MTETCGTVKCEIIVLHLAFCKKMFYDENIDRAVMFLILKMERT